jgi:hypothetical protein
VARATTSTAVVRVRADVRLAAVARATVAIAKSGVAPETVTHALPARCRRVRRVRADVSAGAAVVGVVRVALAGRIFRMEAEAGVAGALAQEAVEVGATLDAAAPAVVLVRLEVLASVATQGLAGRAIPWGRRKGRAPASPECVPGGTVPGTAGAVGIGGPRGPGDIGEHRSQCNRNQAAANAPQHRASGHAAGQRAGEVVQPLLTCHRDLLVSHQCGGNTPTATRRAGTRRCRLRRELVI